MVGRVPKEQHPTLWQDFTFCDQTMTGKTQRERMEKNTITVDIFRKRIKREFPDLWMTGRKEWESRKSGILIGQDLPACCPNRKISSQAGKKLH
jgi:hypothetical protein